MYARNMKVICGKLNRNVPVIGTIRMLVANLASKTGNFLRLHLMVNFKLSVLIIIWETAS